MTSRRKCTGAKRITETVGCSLWNSGRRAFCTQRSKIVRTYGACRSENAGMRNEKRERSSFTESPRIPEEGSSAQGQSGAKQRRTGGGDGQQHESAVPRHY